MATVSMKKEFTITDAKAFEQLKKDTRFNNSAKQRKLKESSSLAYGAEKLKRFSFR